MAFIEPEQRLFNTSDLPEDANSSLNRTLAMEIASKRLEETGHYDLPKWDGFFSPWWHEPVFTPYSIAVRSALDGIDTGAKREQERIARGMGLDVVDLEARIRERYADIEELAWEGAFENRDLDG